jgi:hypothetical protein
MTVFVGFVALKEGFWNAAVFNLDSRPFLVIPAKAGIQIRRLLRREYSKLYK